MLPLRDNIPSRTAPYVNYTIIAMNAVVFSAQLLFASSGSLVYEFGMIPARVAHPATTITVQEEVFVSTRFGVRKEIHERKIAERVPAWMTVITCIFLHGGWMHILGNMWFLHIFGDNVEDRLGHVGYLVFYLLSGVFASLTHFFTDPNSTIPTVGASGAIAAVMGAYMLLYPHSSVLTLIPLLGIGQIMTIPAPWFLGVWFAIQFFQGTLSLGQTQTSGVAFWAHIGGFVVGFVAALICKSIHVTKPPVKDRIHPSHRPYEFRVDERYD